VKSSDQPRSSLLISHGQGLQLAKVKSFDQPRSSPLINQGQPRSRPSISQIKPNSKSRSSNSKLMSSNTMSGWNLTSRCEPNSKSSQAIPSHQHQWLF
ncbi:hypothetical protein GBA52_008314, partial [Prunus armeniaca]